VRGDRQLSAPGAITPIIARRWPKPQGLLTKSPVGPAGALIRPPNRGKNTLNRDKKCPISGGVQRETVQILTRSPHWTGLIADLS
jgi:hypothetical protein